MDVFKWTERCHDSDLDAGIPANFKEKLLLNRPVRRIGWDEVRKLVGWFACSGGQRFFLERTDVMGMPLLRLKAPLPRRSGFEARRAAKGARLLARAGCRRVLVPPAFPWWPQLREAGLRPVDPAALCQTMAAPLVLADLTRRGIDPHTATVALWGERVNRAFFETAQTLCLQVRTLTISAPNGGADLRRFLREEYGAAALEAGPSAHAAAFFSPVREEHGHGLKLYGPEPNLNGLRFAPAADLPKELDLLPLLALLWEEGRISAQKIKVFSPEPVSAAEIRPVPRNAGTQIRAFLQ